LTQLLIGCFGSKLLIQWMFNPSFFTLDLTGNGELIIFFRQAFAILFYYPTNTDTPKMVV
jgi:hypothetical protein